MKKINLVISFTDGRTPVKRIHQVPSRRAHLINYLSSCIAAMTDLQFKRLETLLEEIGEATDRNHAHVILEALEKKWKKR